MSATDPTAMTTATTTATTATTADPRSPGQRVAHWTAAATAFMTFVLIFAGGMVTSTASGDAEPDWPLGTFKQEWPWLIEMGHRALGSLVGLLAIATAVALAVWEPRRRVRNLAWIVLALVVVQGLVGARRIFVPDDEFPLERAQVAIVHTLLGQAIFAATVALSLLTSRGWLAARPGDVADDDNAGAVRFLALLVPAGTYLQIWLGAVVRHTGAWVALHVVGAMVVALLAGIAVMVVLNRYDSGPLKRAAALLGGLLGAQLTLGIWSLIIFDRAGRSVDASAFVPTLHVVFGVFCLAASLVLAMRLFRYVRIPETGAAPVAATGGAGAGLKPTGAAV